MAVSEDTRRAGKPRLLMTAYHYDRAHSMESRLSWQRAQHAARDYDVTLFCARGDAASRAGSAPPDAVSVVELPLSRLERIMMSGTAAYYLGYRLWHRRVYRAAKRLHSQRPFALVHHVSFCGYREPSDCWRLDAPFVLGPVGGTSAFPTRFLPELDIRGGLRELMRNIANECQLRFAWRVRRAMRCASVVLAANEQVARDLQKCFGVRPVVQLETGIDEPPLGRRPPRNPAEPLRILWAGRMRSWKGLPLLLRALAQLPQDCSYTLRLLGQGISQERWERLAERLGIDANIEWVGWPSYRDQLAHYEWADVFAFTSLRDTSGTGLLEALAAGTPIVGLDHQGAADIMTDDCAVRIPPTSRAAAIEGFRAAIMRVANDPAELDRLSRGASERAQAFQWERQGEVIRQAYRTALASAGVPVDQTAPRRDAEPALAVAGAPQQAFW